jgi:hypothetical protein
MKHSALIACVVIGGAACTDDPAKPENVLELQMTATIPAGTEVEYCKFVQIPDTWVTHDQIEFTTGSHHVLVYQTSYTSIPTHKDDGTPVDTSGVFDCTDGATNGWSIQKLIGGSQNRAGDAILRFPDGIGVHIGGIAMINVHYVNSSDEPLTTDVSIKFDTMPADQVTQEGDILFLYNPLISVPANSSARAHWRCPVYSDITISNVQSHMHRRGVAYEARVDGNAPFYTSSHWENVPVNALEGFTVKAGSKLDYHCDYQNSEARQVYQGPRSTDEMCMLIGSYYPADPRTANCLDETAQLPGGDWVGQGTATCQQTMGCLQGAGDNLGAVTDCVNASKPDVSIELSAALRCFMSSADPLSQCGSQIQACGAK